MSLCKNKLSDMSQERRTLKSLDVHKDLPHCVERIRGTSRRIKCNILNIHPPLPLEWWVDDADYDLGDIWNCTSVWLHCADQKNGTKDTDKLYTELAEAVNILVHTPGAAQYTLLDAPGGSPCDPNRFGHDHLIFMASGTSFTFSVRRGPGFNKILLAIARNTC